MTIKPFLKLASAAVLMGALGTANAASISLVVTSESDNSVTMDMVADFTDAFTIGGGWDVITSGLTLANFESSYPGDPGFSRQPDVLPDLLSGFSFGDFNGLSGDLGTVGTLTFDITGTSWMAMGAETGSIAGPFIDAATFQVIPIDYNTVQNAVIPVPAAAWLMFGGLGALFGFGRKRA